MEFPLFAPVGPNSITNQMAVLSWCLTASLHCKCFDNYNGLPIVGAIFKDKNCFEYGMRLHSNGPRGYLVYCPVNNIEEPFLYDVAKKERYLKFFGEEFLYKRSCFVAQDIVFPLHADILLHKIFCCMAKRVKPKDSVS